MSLRTRILFRKLILFDAIFKPPFKTSICSNCNTKIDRLTNRLHEINDHKQELRNEKWFDTSVDEVDEDAVLQQRVDKNCLIKSHKDNSVKWRFLEHKGPVFPPEYVPLPDDVHFYYNGKVLKLTKETEEMATFYGKMLDHQYVTKSIFNRNFWRDWQKVMTKEEKAIIKEFKHCSFAEIHKFFKRLSEERKLVSKDDMRTLKNKLVETKNKYGYCIIDGRQEKIRNFRIDPPGLFRGRGEHPKQGMHKPRLQPEDIIINCSQDSVWPKPPSGHRWKEVRHDNTVSWLCSWTDNIQKTNKYILLAESSRIKVESDITKYEMARRLHRCIHEIRDKYQNDWISKNMILCQCSVALYLIDKLALRAGSDKASGSADTVGCCSLRVEHLTLYKEKDGKENIVVLDFLGKDSIRYFNSVSVEEKVFENLKLFVENKTRKEYVFDKINVNNLNNYLQEMMEGLTAKLFRTYNASITFSKELDLHTNGDDPFKTKLDAYNKANTAVAILCNHQRAVSEYVERSIDGTHDKVKIKKEEIAFLKEAIKGMRDEYKFNKTAQRKRQLDKKKDKLAKMKEELMKLRNIKTDKDESKDVALETSKVNYLDPRISVAWCKKHQVPIEKVFTKAQMDKFKWAIETTTKDFKF